MANALEIYELHVRVVEGMYTEIYRFDHGMRSIFEAIEGRMDIHYHLCTVSCNIASV